MNFIRKIIRALQQKQEKDYQEAIERMIEKILLDQRRFNRKVYLITSTLPNEGLSEFSQNLSTALIQRDEIKTSLFTYSSHDDFNSTVACEKLNELKKDHELIIVEAGSVFQNNHYISFLDHCDASFMLVKAGGPDRDQIKTAIKEIEDNGLDVIGVIMNSFVEKIPRIVLKLID